IISEYVCPSLGCFIASAVFAAPIHDLSKALKLGSLGNLNTVPWSIMTGNCLGWCSYAYCTNDPFVLAANLPGLILSFWLNIGAANSSLTSSSQDVLFLRVISIWSIIIVCVGWLGILHGYEQKIIGILVNINLIFFYGAPLQTMKTVFETKSSNSIHTPTVTMNVINAIFWISYGLAKNDIIIYGPNGIGLLLGITQGTLCLIYSSSSSS
ncbi:hypothetical protein FRACYDRAFT_161207, partial [Fragilariopsis cylindrus CCMP1102]